MKKTFLALAVVLSSATAVLAQGKIGHINASELVSIMPETKKADTDLKAYAKTLEDQLQKMQTELQTKYEAFQKETTLSDAIKEVRMKELQDLDQRIQEFSQKAQEQLASKKEALYTPILDKAEKAIKAVAAQGQYAYVFDSGVGALLVMPDGDNMMPQLRKYLNIADMPASAPKAPGVPAKVVVPAPKN